MWTFGLGTSLWTEMSGLITFLPCWQPHLIGCHYVYIWWTTTLDCWIRLMENASKQCRRQWGGRATGTVCPGPPVWGEPQTELNSFTGSLFSSQSSFLRGPFHCIVDKVSLLFRFALTLLTQTWKMHALSYVTTVQPLTRAPYVILFNLKSLNEDGNW